MKTLKVDSKGCIKREDGSVMGTPIRTGKIYRSGTRTGRIDLSTAIVYNLKEEPLGKVNLDFWGDLFKVSKEAQKESSSKKCIRTKENPKDEKNDTFLMPKKISPDYVPGKDNLLVVSGTLTRILWPGEKDRITTREFTSLNNERGWNYNNWDQLCAKEDLDEKTLDKYNKYINWYVFTHYHPLKSYSAEFLKKYSSKLS